ncbi:transcriptional regulator, AraC family [Clostridium cavendishii DSM 21758]|uniref:Transcriptional regulator, AraC family n=1 Tax=Clostridium cavendishii DSM 21758 TaxID=1121302 RepID=A0A1M6DIG7_9CLOT|nr:AraC family transcriptional regulator [Clostridium cavendishii]SHI72913.1 transcriptional regulator, AraC family [Clostridium cavendishii DSM 21758]
MKKDIIDSYYEYIEEELNCRTSDELLGKKYIIGNKYGKGNFSRLKIEEGIELTKSKVNKSELYFDNREYNENILEIGYCYSGDSEIITMPHNKQYFMKNGCVFIYKALNNVEHFKFKYNNCKTISIHMNFNTIKNVINPIWEQKIIEDWNNSIDYIFKNDILIIKKANYKMEKLAQEMDEISTDNIMGYMRLKLKTIEFLDAFFQECSKKKVLNNSKSYEKEIVIKAQGIINRNIQKSIHIKTIAEDLNISEYKLQEAFKNILGDTVYEYIKKTRIEKAKILLKNTDMSVLEIVNEIGYENPSKFSSLFKRYNNITPLKYRKTNKDK